MVFSVCLSPGDSTKFCVLMARMWHETRLCYSKSCSRPGRKIIASLQPIVTSLIPLNRRSVRSGRRCSPDRLRQLFDRRHRACRRASAAASRTNLCESTLA
jgi:hypothetical protein